MILVLLVSRIKNKLIHLGFVDADMGDSKYKISIIKAQEYRRTYEEILQVALDLPFDSKKCVKRLLFGPKSVLTQQEPVLPYAFVSDNILVSKKEAEDFVECERMLMWFFHKTKKINREMLTSLIKKHFNHRKIFLYEKTPIIDKIDLRKNELEDIINLAFKNNKTCLEKEDFMTFWAWYGFAVILVLRVNIKLFLITNKVATLWSEGRVYGFSRSTEEIQKILENQSIGSFVIHIPLNHHNKIVLSYVKTEIPSVFVEHQTWTADDISENEIMKSIVEKQLKRYILCTAFWQETKWGDVRLPPPASKN